MAYGIEKHFGFRNEKCLDMAVYGDWWGNSSFSKLAMLHVPGVTAGVIRNFEVTF